MGSIIVSSGLYTKRLWRMLSVTKLNGNWALLITREIYKRGRTIALEEDFAPFNEACANLLCESRGRL